MKNVYPLGDDFFIAMAFISFMVGVILRLLGIDDVGFGITPRGILFFSTMCLLFSISLSLYDITRERS